MPIRCPKIGFFIVNHGIPTTSLGFSRQESLMIGGILTAISQLTESEIGLGQLADIQAESGHIYVSKAGDEALVGFFVWNKEGFPRSIARDLRLLNAILSNHYKGYLYDPRLADLLLVGALPEKFQVKMAYDSVLKWRKQLGKIPFKFTDTLEREAKRFNIEKLKEEDYNINLLDLTFSETIENTIENLTWLTLRTMLENDMSPLITARDLSKVIINIQQRTKTLVSTLIKTNGPAARLRRIIAGYDYQWPI